MEQNDTVLKAFQTSSFVKLCEPDKTPVKINDIVSSEITGIDCSDIDGVNVDESSVRTDLPSDVADRVSGVNNSEVFSVNSVKNTNIASNLVHNQIVCDITTISCGEEFKPETLARSAFVNENSGSHCSVTSYIEIELKDLKSKEIKDMNIEKRSIKHSAPSSFCENELHSSSIKTNLRVTDTPAKCGRINCTNTKSWKSGTPPFVNLPEATFPLQPTKSIQSGVGSVTVDKEEKAYPKQQTELKTKPINSNEKIHHKKKNLKGMSGDLTLDINGNFSERRQHSGLTRNSGAMQGSISRNGDGYERQPSKSEMSHRKIKHTRNTNDSHCYNLSDGIGLQNTNNDELASDKKYKLNKSAASLGIGGTRKVYYSQNLTTGNKTIPSEELIKKDRIKDAKTTFSSNKNWRSSKQRGFPVHDSSEEEKEINAMNYKRNPQNEGGDNETVSSSACASNIETYLDWSACVPDSPEEKNSSVSSEALTSSMISASNCANSSFTVDNEVSSFVRDFYAVTDPEQQPEESEFKVVVKKQRKHQPKRLDSCRRFSATSGSAGSDHEFHTQSRSHTDKMMIFANLPIPHHSQLRKLDPLHCKSTSSMPPSEHSSADNSDLDSVHSLPVGSSASNASCSVSLPATSSASATLQASYADIARNMPLASKPHTCNVLRQPQTVSVKITEQNASFAEVNSLIIHNSASTKQITSDYPNDNLHDIKSCIVSSEGIIFHPSSDSNKESFYAHPSLENVKKSSFITGLQFTSKDEEANREIVNNKPSSQSEISAENSELSCAALSQKTQHRVPNNSSHLETCIGSVHSQWVSTTTKNSAEGCNSSSNENKSAFIKHKGNSRQKQPAVIIMDNCLPTSNVSGVSFGIDFNELLQLNSSNDSVQTSPVLPLSGEASSSIAPNKAEPYGQSSDKRTENASQVKSTVHSKHTPSSSIQKTVEDQGHIPSPNVIAGLCIRWKDLAVDTRTFNYEQIVSFLYKAWDDTIQENSKDSSVREGMRMKYYSDTNP